MPLFFPHKCCAGWFHQHCVVQSEASQIDWKVGSVRSDILLSPSINQPKSSTRYWAARILKTCPPQSARHWSQVGHKPRSLIIIDRQMHINRLRINLLSSKEGISVQFWNPLGEAKRIGSNGMNLDSWLLRCNFPRIQPLSNRPCRLEARLRGIILNWWSHEIARGNCPEYHEGSRSKLSAIFIISLNSWIGGTAPSHLMHFGRRLKTPAWAFFQDFLRQYCRSSRNCKYLYPTSKIYVVYHIHKV